MGVKKKPQDALSVSDLGLDASEIGGEGSRTEVYAIGEPPARGESRRIEDDGDAAEAILEYLAEKKLV
jgi:electron transfer flavoprotein beta subunit